MHGLEAVLIVTFIIACLNYLSILRDCKRHARSAILMYLGSMGGRYVLAIDLFRMVRGEIWTRWAFDRLMCEIEYAGDAQVDMSYGNSWQSTR